MSCELIDGRGETDHIDSPDVRMINRAIWGNRYVAEYGDNLSCTLSDANTAVIGTGVLIHDGGKVIMPDPTEITIRSGVAGEKRIDYICGHYHLDTGTRVETYSLDVIEGTPVASNPQPPSIPAGSIDDTNVTDSYMPLWSIQMDEVIPGTPKQLFQTMSPVQDSLTRMREYGFTTCSAGIVTKTIPANGTHAFEPTWTRAFASTPQVVGWYATDNIWSITVTNVTKTGARIVVRNVSSSTNGAESRVYVTAYGQLA